MSEAAAEAAELRHLVPDVETLAQRLAGVDYLVDEALATSMFLALRLPQPLLLEGEAGVGKTEAANALAAVLDTPLIRLQCYEGIDAAEALYEWNYPRQLLAIRLAEAQGTDLREGDLFAESTWLAVPCCARSSTRGRDRRCCSSTRSTEPTTTSRPSCSSCWPRPTVTIPELGTITATHPPIIVLTSNRTRDLHDAVKRRCLYQWIDYPGRAARGGDRPPSRAGRRRALAVQVADAVARMRAAGHPEAAGNR